ncbi:SGNH/GDSL hydrolase family protein [Nodularia sp. NIES-3585]|uniref:SGNH/GDSL hydrolase family protein n=1 Tax=Nodularia sp. NIES-3585 TaxID=1973477 RepID=UPI0020CB7F75|nr:SGNH/GDSL hydrolase family protein [Nodularia sp. NIES-3585]
MLPLRASAAIFSQVFVFGDSTVDDGNFFKITQNKIPPKPYFEGRFSNGPVWVEYLAEDLGLKTTNFGVAGSTTGELNTLNKSLPGLTQQIKSFSAFPNFQADADGLYIISAGANDYLGAGIQEVIPPVDNLVAALAELAAVGAKNFLIANLPDLGNTPLTKDTDASVPLNFLTGLHNFALGQSFQSLSQQQPNLNINLFDVNSLISQITKNSGEFGLTNVTDSCLEQPIEVILATGNFTQCSNPDEYLFWDGIHPTTATHRLIADAALVALGPQSVPEPGAVLGMLAFGALGAAGVLKRQQKKFAFTPASLALVAQSSHTRVEN